MSSRDILEILRQYNIADEHNVPRNIEAIKNSNPTSISTLISFIFSKKAFYLIFDDTANDNNENIINQLKSTGCNIKGSLLINPKDDNKTYAMPHKGKDCYLFAVISEKKRLDSELSKRYPEHSRSTWQKYIKSGCVSLDEKIIDSPKAEVSNIDNLVIELPNTPDYSNDKLPIIFIDDNVIVIDKPAGVLTHAKGVLSDEFTVADFFRNYTTYNLETNRPGIVHRLDRDTSGIIIGARNQETAMLLQKQFADRKTKKTYIAIVDGLPKIETANINLPIERNPAKPSTFRVGSNGKNALTNYRILAFNEKRSLLELCPKTGRTHQLRVHMQYLKNPITGDKVYGKSDDRLFLHAHKLEITIPNGDRRTFLSPIPESFLGQFPDFDKINYTKNETKN